MLALYNNTCSKVMMIIIINEESHYVMKTTHIPQCRIYTSTVKSPSAVQISKSIKQTQSVDKI